MADERHQKADLFLSFAAFCSGFIVALIAGMMTLGYVPLSGNIIYKLGCAFLVCSISFTFRWRKRAHHADMGAWNEERVMRAIAPLRAEWWRVATNQKRRGRNGDFDFILQSPSKQTFVIEVKSMGGYNISPQTNFYPYFKRKNVFATCRSQAAEVKDRLGVSWVQAILCLPSANVSNGYFHLAHEKVYVTDALHILPLLRHLDFEAEKKPPYLYKTLLGGIK